MKVGDLIELLKDFDPELPVHFAYNYGDYWKTRVAPEVHAIADGHVKYSDYHSMDQVASENDVEDDEETKACVILEA